MPCEASRLPSHRYGSGIEVDTILSVQLDGERVSGEKANRIEVWLSKHRYLAIIEMSFTMSDSLARVHGR